MNRTIIALLTITLVGHVAAAGKFSIDEEGDGGRETYLEIDQERSLVIVGCSVKNGIHDFGIAVPINDPKPGSMWETMQKDADASIRGSVCVGDFCKKVTFSLSDYFGGPSTNVSFDDNQVSSAQGVEVELPGGLSLKWTGQMRDVLQKACR